MMPSNDLGNIINYRIVDDHISTGGQPTQIQFYSIKDAGYELIINLSLPDSPGAIQNEAEVVRNLGVDYVHIPVDFKSPQQKELDKFYVVMKKNNNKKIFVHCAFNWRVSVFVSLYRIIHCNIPREIAINELKSIWQPDDTWQKFINDSLSVNND